MHVEDLWADLAAELPGVLASYRDRLPTLEVSHKLDRTLLTEADLAVESLIIGRIRQADATASIIAEEPDTHGDVDVVSRAGGGRVWVIDPIDGTAEFVRPERVEFCSVVCVLDSGVPSEALVVAPELGPGRSPLVLTASRSTRTVTVNGAHAELAVALGPSRIASVTRSAGSLPRPFEATMVDAGCHLKTRTTSQTLDMVRTAVALAPVAESSPRRIGPVADLHVRGLRGTPHESHADRGRFREPTPPVAVVDRPGTPSTAPTQQRRSAGGRVVGVTGAGRPESWQGNRSLVRFVDQALICDDAMVGDRNSLSARLRGWGAFQAANVRRAAGHHGDRIATGDGIEDDEFGQWARAAGVVLQGPLRRIAPVGEEAYVAATLARGMRYQARAVAKSLTYQPHPMRRDFLLTFDLTRDGAPASMVFDAIRAVRGVQDYLTISAGDEHTSRMQLLELELPLLGGRLWRTEETRRLDDQRWIELVVQRIADYRHRDADLRVSIERCVTEEDYLRLVRDIDAARKELSERFGFRPGEASALEREIVGSVASVAEAVPGIPQGQRSLARYPPGPQAPRTVGNAGPAFRLPRVRPRLEALRALNSSRERDTRC